MKRPSSPLQRRVLGGRGSSDDLVTTVYGVDGIAPAPSARVSKPFPVDYVTPNNEAPVQIWQHTAKLLSFWIVFAVIIGVLVMLVQYSRKHQGFAIYSSLNPFALRYAPTGAFVVIIAFWRQLDYIYKVQAPWIQLHKVSVLLNRAYYWTISL
jgi:hypothetical protein